MEINRQVQLFNKQAGKYARRAKQQSSDQKMRRRLLQGAKGTILEVSVGAGANFQYYPKASKITAVDFSPEMIEQARLTARGEGLDVEFQIGNVEEIVLPEKSFDIVVSTLSLCSYPNPEKVLQRLSSWCKDDGQVLLFEHGISTNSMFAWLQHKTDPFFLKRNGCHMNRDILKLVDESPLSIIKRESYMLNAVHLIWGKPSI
ncbi:class I SAM-dependent methyltransferase [Fredinandcohnia sp. 179-A 10B2 NHS]|uniref:class I SAM-dependent methyltransferase n=1 Tax=Fredinandcohnia sp. 179-A 10B2 NHS TaxID=3235176 RepID=UPI0039A09BAA